MSLRDKIAAKQPASPVPFHSAVLDEQVFIRRLTGQETKQYWVWCQGKTAGQLQQKLVQLGLGEDNGAQVFKPEDVDNGEIGKLSNAFLEEIADEVSRVNLLTIGHVKELRERFFKTRASDGSSSSPATSASSTPTD